MTAKHRDLPLSDKEAADLRTSLIEYAKDVQGCTCRPEVHYRWDGCGILRSKLAHDADCPAAD